MKKLTGAGLALFLIFGVAGVTYFAATYLTSPEEKPVSAVFQALGGGEDRERALITPGTIVRIETRYACGDVITEFQGPATRDLQGLTETKVRELYPSSSGWEINKLSSGIVQLSKDTKELCDRHRDYRHLGIHENMLAVYHGPLGYNNDLIRVEKSIPLSSLPPDFRANLQNAMNFQNQDESTKLELRTKLEFPSENHLNAALDSIDEMNGGR